MKFHVKFFTAFSLLASTCLMASETSSKVEIDATTAADLITQIQQGRILSDSLKTEPESESYKLLVLAVDAIKSLSTTSLFKSNVKDHDQLLLLEGKLQPCTCEECSNFKSEVVSPASTWEQTLIDQLSLNHAAFQCAENLLSKIIEIFDTLKNDRDERCGNTDELYRNLEAEYATLLESIRQYQKDVVLTIQAHKKNECFSVVEIDPDTITFEESPLLTKYLGITSRIEENFTSTWQKVKDVSMTIESATGDTGTILQKIELLHQEIEYYTDMKRQLLQAIADRTEKEMKGMNGNDELDEEEDEESLLEP